MKFDRLRRMDNPTQDQLLEALREFLSSPDVIISQFSVDEHRQLGDEITVVMKVVVSRHFTSRSEVDEP